ncbi:preprotein translocase subunit SecY [Pseudomonadota bacterium]
MNSDLKNRILLTLLILLIYRIGTFIPVPGIDYVVIEKFFNSETGSIFDMVNMFSGGALSRMSIFALGIMPYITASIIMQLMSSVSKTFSSLKKEGEYGRKKINQYTRYLTIILCFVQAVGVYYALNNMEESAFISDSQIFFWTTTFSLVGGTVILMWFGERITSSGIGNGISLIIFIGIISEFPSMFVRILELSKSGVYSWLVVILLLAFFIGFIFFITFIEKIVRKIKIQYPNRGMMISSGMSDSSFLPLKLNMSGVIPPIFASSILMFPTVVSQFVSEDTGTFLSSLMSRGSILYFLFFGGLIAFFTFFYSSIIFNTEEVSDNLKKGNAFIPGVRPGKTTAEYLDTLIMRLTTLGAIYLVFVCIVPEFLMTKYSIPLAFGGTGILIVVNVITDLINQIQSYLFADMYKNMSKKRKIRVR